MAKIITFSRQFPEYHPKHGEKTHFVEKIWKGLWDMEPSDMNPVRHEVGHYNDAFPVSEDPMENIHKHIPKYHTIRQGNRWKVGDLFSPRVWSGKPYASPMITIATDIRIEKVWKFEIVETSILLDGELISSTTLSEIAKNDGLTIEELTDWFKFPNEFSGQIICWNSGISYSI